MEQTGVGARMARLPGSTVSDFAATTCSGTGTYVVIGHPRCASACDGEEGRSEPHGRRVLTRIAAGQRSCIDRQQIAIISVFALVIRWVPKECPRKCPSLP